MRLYPTPPVPRRRTLLLDALALVLLLLFAWLGFKVHDAVLELNSLSRGVAEAGTSVQGTLRSAGEAVGGLPLVGNQIGDALSKAGRETGGSVVATGREAESRVNGLADLLGMLTWLVPSILLLTRFLPDRLRQIGRLTSGARVLQAAPMTPEGRELVARRAAFGLPYAELARHTSDPFGDLAAGRHDALVAAEFESAGLSPPPPQPAAGR